MKLVSFTVNNYRSIQSAYKVTLSDYTVLVGPNNEGKSNLLQALVVGLNLLLTGRGIARGRRAPLNYLYRKTSDRPLDFEWQRDYPVQLQQTKPDGCSILTLEFQLDEAELTEFRDHIKTSFTTNLKLEFSLGQGSSKVSLLMNGPAKQSLNDKLGAIIEFIRAKLMVQYVSAIRPTEMSIRIIEDLIRIELEQLSEDSVYAQTLATLQSLQAPVFRSVAARIKDSMTEFLPSVQDVTIRQDEETRSGRIRRDYSILINDGAETELAFKGDGLISLAAISLVSHSTQRALRNRFLILAIEEPESHLHPKAIHQLKNVLAKISETHQVIVTTHSPILVDRGRPKNNIIVQGNRAQSASNIQEIRDSLGILTSDNLITTAAILLVEGECDEIILRKLLPAESKRIAAALEAGLLAIERMGSASKLSYSAQMYKSLLCSVHAFVDNDQAGNDAIKQALDDKRLDANEYTIATVPGLNQSEIEDMLDPSCYAKSLLEEFQIDMELPRFRTNKAKWSDRIKGLAAASGKLADDVRLAAIKQVVAERVAEKGPGALHPNRRESFDALVRAVEALLPLS